MFPFCRTTPDEVQKLPDTFQMLESGLLILWVIVNAHREQAILLPAVLGTADLSLLLLQLRLRVLPIGTQDGRASTPSMAASHTSAWIPCVSIRSPRI